MAAEDQFTSIQWDREEIENAKPTNPTDTIVEEEESHDSSPSDHQDHPMNHTPSTNSNWVDPDNQEDNDSLSGPTDSMILSKDADVPLTEPLEVEAVKEPHQAPEMDPEETESIATVELITTKRRSLQQHDVQPETGLSLSLSPTGGTTAVESSSHDESLANQVAYKLVCSVTEPLRDMEAQKPFISYLVTTITTNPSIVGLSLKKQEIGSGESLEFVIKIRRRYGDFRFLYDCLMNDYPTLLVPPLPSKLNLKYLTGDTLSTDFVQRRRNSLDRFVRYLLQHNVFARLKVFHLFLSDSNEWLTFQKNLKIAKGGSSSTSGPGELESFPSSVMNKVVNEELLTETIMNFLTPLKHKRENNKDIIEISDKLKKLYENLIKLDRIFSRLNKKEFDLQFDYQQFLNQITKLSTLHNHNSEDEETPDTQVTANFKVFADSLSYFLENWLELHKYIDESFIVSLKDCTKYIINLTNLIELQHNKKIDLQVLQDYLQKTKSELAGMTGSQHSSAPNPVVGSHTSSTGIVNNTTQLIKDTLSTGSSGQIGSSHAESKKLKLLARVEQLEEEIKTQTLLVNELTNKIVNEEYPNWDKFNKTELKNTMIDLCDHQIAFYSGLVTKWSSAEIKLLNRLQELS